MKTLTALGFLAMLAAARAETLTLARSIRLPDVEGRIDHFAIDRGDRLFVAALGNNSVEVIDLKSDRVVHSIKGLAEPQGILFVAEFNRLYVANGSDGAVHVFDGTTYAPITGIKFEDDADNVRYDAAARRIYVGYGGGALGVIDAGKNSIVGNIPLQAHPESFQLEKNGTRVFVNVPGAHEVTVVDRQTQRPISKWPLGLVAANFPMTLDETDHRAFVACRRPARLLIFDTESGRETARLDLHGDCDDAFYDPKRRQVYASCGEGFIDVFTQIDPDHYALKETIKTMAKARTGFFSGDRMYLAVPRQGGEDAQIRVYEFRP